MNSMSGERRLTRWLRWPLYLCLALGLLLSVAPASVSFGQTGAGGAGSGSYCRGSTPPLLQEYVDVSAGLTLRYPDGWLWRARNDALPGTRSDIVWFGPTPRGSTTDVECILTVRLAMHYFLIDTTLEEMRNVTAMLDLASLLSRYLQQEAARPAGPNVNVPAPIPNQGIPEFWGQFNRRQFWGAERLVLPSGNQYYREIGIGPVQDIQRNERNGNVERYVIAVSPRAMLEVVAEFTAAEYERGYSRLPRQMLDTLQVWDAVSPNPGPIGQSVAGPADDACQVVILANDLLQRPQVTQARVPGPERFRQQPFLDRSAVSQRFEVQGVAFATDGGTDLGCDETVEQMGLFLQPPIDGVTQPVQTISVYNLPSPGAPLPEVGYYLSWAIPPDQYGQRNVYIAARLSDGRWSWITRQVNMAPPLSVEIDVNPPEVEVGQFVSVVMRVFNNTANVVRDVQPQLFPMQGPGTAVLRSGPDALQSGVRGCDLASPPASRRAAFVPTPVPASQGPGGPGQAQALAPRAGEPAPVTLQPANGAQNCVLFQWSFTALRSGPISFTGTAEGRLAGGGMRLLSRFEEPLAAVTPREMLAQTTGETGVSAPITTATDVQVRAVELMSDGPAVVLPVLENPRALQVLVPVRNRSFATLYNVRADFAFVGVRGIPASFSLPSGQDGPPVGYVITGTTCLAPQRVFGLNLTPRLPGIGPVSIVDALTEVTSSNIQPGDTIPVLNPSECAIFARTIEVPLEVELTAPLYVVGEVTCQTRFGASQSPGGLTPGQCASFTVQGGPYSVSAAQDLLSPSERRRLPEGAIVPPIGPFPPRAANLNESGLSQQTLQQALQSGSSATGRATLLEDGTSLGAGTLGQLTPPGQTPPGQTPPGGTGPGGTTPPGGVAGPPPVPTPGSNIPTVAGQDAAIAAGALGAITDCPPQTGPLQICLRAYPLLNREVRYFNVGDTIRLEMLVRNTGDVGLTNVRPGPVAVNGATVGGGGLAFGRDPVSVAAGDAAAQAAAAVAARGASTDRAAAAAQAAAEGVRAAAAGSSGAPSEDQCTLELRPPGGIANQIRQIAGPNPLSIGRLPRNGTATITWDFLVQEMRGGPQLVFQTFVGGDSSEGSVVSAAIQTDPLEKRVLCIFPTMEVSQTRLQTGQNFTVTMRGENSTYFLRSTQQFTPGRYYFDMFPSELRPIIEEGAVLQLEVLQGPNNPITANPIYLGPSEVTNFTWQFNVQGNGCFRLRGQLTGRQQRSAQGFFSNTVETPRICVEGPIPRINR